MFLDDRYAARDDVTAIQTQLVNDVDYWWNEVWPEYTGRLKHERIRPIIEAIVAKYATEREDELREEFSRREDHLRYGSELLDLALR